VYEHSADIMQGASVPGPLVERAVIGLIRVCQRLLPYKGEHAPQLLQSLQLLFKLHPRVAETMLERISREMLALLKGSMAYIKDAGGWKTVCKLLAAVACHQEAAPVGLEALSLVMGEPVHVTLVNFAPCVDAAMAYVDSRVGGAERSTVAVDLLAGLQVQCFSILPPLALFSRAIPYVRCMRAIGHANERRG
jgi:brefeldin A-resistance guanine nucleotide exchange factor 1